MCGGPQTGVPRFVSGGRLIPGMSLGIRHFTTCIWLLGMHVCRDLVIDLLFVFLAVSCVGTTVAYCRLSPCPKCEGRLIHETVCAAYFCMKIGPPLINHCLTPAAGYS